MEKIDEIMGDIIKGKYGYYNYLQDNLGEELYNKYEEKIIKMYSNKTIDEIVDEIFISKMFGKIEELKLKYGIMYNIIQNRLRDEYDYSERLELNEKQIEILAKRTIKGEFGNGMERKNKLGIDHKIVQNAIHLKTHNEIQNLPKLTIDEYIDKLYFDEISDVDLKKKTGDSLYNFIRNKVNERNGNNKRYEINKECIDILAKATINLEFSNGEERKEKLGELYPFVQNRVNEMLKAKSRCDTSKKPYYLNI